MIKNVQGTNFKSRISISQSVYDAKPHWLLRKLGKSVEHPWRIQDSKYLKSCGYTDGAVTCVSGLLKAKGGKEFFIFHLDPYAKNNTWQNVKMGLLKAQEHLQAKNKNVQLQGFLLGANPQFSKSTEFSQEILKFFQETGVQVTALLRQKSMPNAHFHYSLPKDEVTVAFPQCDNVRSVRELKNRFEEVLISEDDQIFYGEKSLKDRFKGFCRIFM